MKIISIGHYLGVKDFRQTHLLSGFYASITKLKKYFGKG